MGLIDTTRMRPGVYVEIDGNPHVVISYQHVNPGKGGAFVRMRFKNLTSGSVLDRTIKAGDVLPEAEIAKRSYAVIVDEAHSSQTGETARELKAILGAGAGDDAEGETDWEDSLNQVMASRGRQPNLSFFAYTATPKGKTLEQIERQLTE